MSGSRAKLTGLRLYRELYFSNHLNNVTMFSSKFQRIWSLLSWERTADLIRGKVKIEKKTEPGAK